MTHSCYCYSTGKVKEFEHWQENLKKSEQFVIFFFVLIFTACTIRVDFRYFLKQYRMLDGRRLAGNAIEVWGNIHNVFWILIVPKFVFKFVNRIIKNINKQSGLFIRNYSFVGLEDLSKKVNPHKQHSPIREGLQNCRFGRTILLGRYSLKSVNFVFTGFGFIQVFIKNLSFTM